MPQDGLVLAFAILAPEVDALLRTTFKRLTGDKSLGVWESVDKIIEVVQMVGKSVVAVEPGKIRQLPGLVLAWESWSVYAATVGLFKLAFVVTWSALVKDIFSQVAMYHFERGAQFLQLFSLSGRDREVDVF